MSWWTPPTPRGRFYIPPPPPSFATLDHFHLFPYLPAELRFKIWDYAIYEPRVIEVGSQRHRVLTLSLVAPGAIYFRGPVPSPPIMQVCREARYALSTCKPAFKTDLSDRYIYISFPHDTVLIETETLHVLLPNELQNITGMILESNGEEEFGFRYDLGVILKHMGNLRELTIRSTDEVVYGWSGRSRAVMDITRDLEEAREERPGWVCPTVRILKSSTSEEMGVFEGGALVPGRLDIPKRILTPWI